MVGADQVGLRLGWVCVERDAIFVEAVKPITVLFNGRYAVRVARASKFVG